MALKRQIPEEYMDYDYGFTGVSEEEYRKKETLADQKVSEIEATTSQKLRDASLQVNRVEAAKFSMLLSIPVILVSITIPIIEITNVSNSISFLHLFLKKLLQLLMSQKHYFLIPPLNYVPLLEHVYMLLHDKQYLVTMF